LVQIKQNFHVMMDLTLWTIVVKRIQEVEEVYLVEVGLRPQNVI